MFPKNCVRIEIDIEKGTDGAGWKATDDYTFFRERESPAENSLKNKVIIDFHTGAAAENRNSYMFFPVAVDVSHSLRAWMRAFYIM